MINLKSIFDNAAKETSNNFTSYLQYPASEDIPEIKVKKEKTIGERIQEAAKSIDPYEAAMNYQKTVEYFKAQKARLPGRVETGGMMSFKSPGQISSMPGATRGLRAESFTDKIGEVRQRMRAFATDKYYSDITYGK